MNPVLSTLSRRSLYQYPPGCIPRHFIISLALSPLLLRILPFRLCSFVLTILLLLFSSLHLRPCLRLLSDSTLFSLPFLLFPPTPRSSNVSLATSSPFLIPARRAHHTFAIRSRYTCQQPPSFHSGSTLHHRFIPRPVSSLTHHRARSNFPINRTINGVRTRKVILYSRSLKLI